MKIKIAQDGLVMPVEKAPAPMVTGKSEVPMVTGKTPVPAVADEPGAPMMTKEAPAPATIEKPGAPMPVSSIPTPAVKPDFPAPAVIPPSHLTSTGHTCFRAQAEQIFAWAAEQHGGGWVGHSRTAARVAETIAERASRKLGAGRPTPRSTNSAEESPAKLDQNDKIPTLDPDRAYVLALLHDIGRYEGNTQLHHIIAGYHLLTTLGFPEEARICLTHSCYSMKLAKNPTYWPGIDNPAELRFLVNFINTVELDDYDRLVQLADLMSLGAGVFTINDRFCDSVSRYHLSDPAEDLRARQALKTHFDRLTGVNIYTLFREEIARHALNP